MDGQTLLRVAMTIGDNQLERVLLLRRDGHIFQSELEMPFGKMVTRATDRETALQAAAGGSLPAESYHRTMARSNVRFADARAIERIKLKITHRKPELGWPALRGPSQTIVEKNASNLVLEVVRPTPNPVISSDVNEARYLRPNQILQSDDPQVARLAREIVGEETDRYKNTRKLQDWVAGNLTFDLGIALAPASEVARNRRGTCAAYSVLFASMARAVGIPSRVALGYIYAAGIWGGHAWVEVLIDGQWLPFDAAGYRPGIADAARFQFDSYTLEDNLAAGSLAGLQLYGNIDVAVVEYSIAGQTFHVPEATKLYSVDGNEYRNPWLGFSMSKPETYNFSKLDTVYPDRTVLQMEGESANATLVLMEALFNPEAGIRKALDEIAPDAQPELAKLDGRDAVVVSSAGKARLVARDGQSLWVLTAEGSNARGVLDRIAGGWKWLSSK